MRLKILIALLTMASTTFAFAGGKYKTVTIDEKKVGTTHSASKPARKYEQKIKSLLKQELTSVDVHLADEGSLRWLFVVVSLREWNSLSKDHRKELVELLLRHMKQNYPKYGLKVSLGLNADQSLAEGEWGLLSNGPSVKVVGE